MRSSNNQVQTAPVPEIRVDLIGILRDRSYRLFFVSSDDCVSSIGTFKAQVFLYHSCQDTSRRFSMDEGSVNILRT